MSAARDLLVEIGTEELPPNALWSLAQAFAEAVHGRLEAASLTPQTVHPYATPRRLALVAEGVPVEQPERAVERRGPPLSAAFDAEGRPTQAAEGFARKQGTTVEALERLETDKGAWLVYRAVEPGQPARGLIPRFVNEALAALAVPRRMRWGTGEDLFVRPVHWAVLLFGEDVIETEILGVRSGGHTRGHRFHHPAPMPVGRPGEYVERLRREGFVLADFEARRETIRRQVSDAAVGLGARAVADEGLLEEVCALVEWPVALTGSFDAGYLALPREVLVASMTGHQRYFPVEDTEGQLLPHFIAIANIESRDPQEVRRGNERVLRPRLADAAFFWDADRKTPLEDRRPVLDSMVFQEHLGTLRDKTLRVETLAGHIARAMGEDPAPARRAAELAKCDLLTHMVGEFPELQGIMGRHYAAHDGEPQAVAQAIEEQYRPRHAGDGIPASAAGQALAVADRLDTLVGIFAVGQAPTGDKDPFGLRRAALGVLRILIEAERDLDLATLIADAVGHLPEGVAGDSLAEQVLEFAFERLRSWYADRGVSPDVFEAVAARRPARPYDFDRRIQAVAAFRRRPEAESLSAANKRIRNILRQAEGIAAAAVDPTQLEHPAERQLAEALEPLAEEVAPLLAAGRYTETLEALAALREPVDAFFDQVMVMAEDPGRRANRLALLARLAGLFGEVAELSRLH